jgi:glycosyltransferase involved in cell wall biosynthesis
MSDRNPRVSIGLPVYNGEQHVAEAIESLLTQTYDDFELIISDNASSDSTETICRSFAERDSRIRYHRQPRNKGGMWNFNHVVGLARGRYFKWAAHDDICAPTFLERCVEALDDIPEIVACYTQAAKIDRTGRRVSEDPEEGLGPRGVVHTTEAGFPRKYHDSSHPHRRFQGVLLGTHWAVDFFGVIRTDVLRQTLLIPYCYGGEKVLTAELALHGPFHEIPETLFFTRVHSAASGNDNSASAQRSFNAPKASRLSEFTRLKLLIGYVRAVQNTKLGLGERFKCWLVILRYLLQVNKWKRIFRNLLSGAGVGNRKLRPASMKGAT